jgi:hypothetical protein
LFTVYVPEGEPTTFIDGNKSYTARSHSGRTVIDLPSPYFFTQTILLSKNGLAWERENPEALEWIAKNRDAAMSGNAFPGENRVAPIRTAVAANPEKKATVMVKMTAPAGVTSYSHGGIEQQVKGRVITVASDVADILRSHGFQDAA